MDPLDRLQGRLAEVLRERGVAGLSHECTIAEIYQQLIPYRAVRNELGFGELPEYEHALLRLLSGERGYVSVDLPQVQEEFRAELDATNPILGVYRDYAAVGVAVQCADPPPRPSAPDSDAAAPEPEAPPPRPVRIVPAPTEPVPAAVAAERPAPADGSACPHCGEALPRGREARFCPYCGVGVRPMPCPECGEEVEPHWRFCATCGCSSPFPTR